MIKPINIKDETPPNDKRIMAYCQKQKKWYFGWYNSYNDFFAIYDCSATEADVTHWSLEPDSPKE